MSMTIQNVRHPDGSCADLFLEDGRIQQVGPAGSLAAGTESSIDGDGYLLLPLCDCHAHLDKTTLGLDWIKNEVKPGLVNLIANEGETPGSPGGWTLPPGSAPHPQLSRVRGAGNAQPHRRGYPTRPLPLLEGPSRPEGTRICSTSSWWLFPRVGLWSRPGTL